MFTINIKDSPPRDRLRGPPRGWISETLNAQQHSLKIHKAKAEKMTYRP